MGNFNEAEPVYAALHPHTSKRSARSSCPAVHAPFRKQSGGFKVETFWCPYDSVLFIVAHPVIFFDYWCSIRLGGEQNRACSCAATRVYFLVLTANSAISSPKGEVVASRKTKPNVKGTIVLNYC
ncbi:hypothetical protein Ancab_009074 [Ancistrocladus abbreviatus]